MIRKFSVAGGVMAADLTSIGGSELNAKIAPVHLTNVGGSRGASPGVVGAQIAGVYLKNTLTSVANSQIQASMNKLLGDDKVSEGLDAAKSFVNGLLGN